MGVSYGLMKKNCIKRPFLSVRTSKTTGLCKNMHKPIENNDIKETFMIKRTSIISLTLVLLVLIPTAAGALSTEQYIFIDYMTTISGTSDDVPMMIDFPTYRIESGNVLNSSLAVPVTAQTKVILGRGLALNGGVGGGISSNLVCYDNLTEPDLFSVVENGQLQCYYLDEWVTLNPGQTWNSSFETTSYLDFNGRLVVTKRLTYYGVWEKTNIVTPDLTPQPTPIATPVPTPTPSPVNVINLVMSTIDSNGSARGTPIDVSWTGDLQGSGTTPLSIGPLDTPFTVTITAPLSVDMGSEDIQYLQGWVVKGQPIYPDPMTELTVTVGITGPVIDIRGFYTQAAETPVPASTPEATPGSARGDVNGDRQINIVDALLVAQAYVGLNVSIDTVNADVDCDGAVTIVDALLITQRYVGLITQFC
jgi:hypothetical protein